MRKVFILAVLGILCLPARAAAQAVVLPSPVPRIQFFGANGAPLASGCVFTSQSGSSTPLASYVDFTGVTQNENPTILDSGGFGSFFLTNNAYRFKVVAYDGIPGNNCAAGIQQYVIDGINPFGAINLANNLFLSGQTSDPSGTAGELIYRSDIPCIRSFTTFWDCMVRLTDTQTLTNKTLTSPTINTPTITTAALNGVTSVGGVQAFQASGTTLQVGGNAASAVTLFAGNDTVHRGPSM